MNQHNVCVMADNFKCGQSNDGSASKGPNEWLAKKFDQLHEMYEGVQGKSFFSIRQYHNGTRTFGSHANTHTSSREHTETYARPPDPVPLTGQERPIQSLPVHKR